MGKGNRTSRQRLASMAIDEEKTLHEKEKAKSQKRNGRIVASACIVFALIIVAVLVLNILSDAGVFLRGEFVMKQSNASNSTEVVVDKAMMTFFINDNITNWYNNYYLYVQYGLISLDTSKDLKDQKLTEQDASYLGDATLKGVTWYSYFVDPVIENVEMYVTYASAAKRLGITLTDEDYSEIDATVSEIKAALDQGRSSFSQQYGTGVSEKDVRNCYELIYLASAYGEKFQADTEANLEAEEGKTTIINYPYDNKSAFFSAKYLSYSISVSEKTEGTQKLYDDAVKAAKAAAEKIATAKTPADFVALVEAYEESVKKNTSNSTTTETGSESETASVSETTSASETTSTTTSADKTEKYTGSIYYETDDELGKWIFAETEAASVGDSKVIEEKEKTSEKPTTSTSTSTSTESESETGAEKETDSAGNIVYENYKVTVYLLTQTPDLDRSLTQNIAYLITDDKTAAEAFLEAFLKSEKKNRDVFEELAGKQYDALFAEHDHDESEEHVDPTFNYAQVDQAKEKYFNDDFNALNDWLDDADRKDGSYTSELIKVTTVGSDSKLKTYYVALYFESHDEISWYVDALAGATQKAIDDWYKAELDKKLITYNMDAIEEIALLKYSMN